MHAMLQKDDGIVAMGRIPRGDHADLEVGLCAHFGLVVIGGYAIAKYRLSRFECLRVAVADRNQLRPWVLIKGAGQIASASADTSHRHIQFLFIHVISSCGVLTTHSRSSKMLKNQAVARQGREASTRPETGS